MQAEQFIVQVFKDKMSLQSAFHVSSCIAVFDLFN